jgi:hypothetical protein
VVVVGDTLIAEEVFPPGDHTYVVPPLAERVAIPPAQMVKGWLIAGVNPPTVTVAVAIPGQFKVPVEAVVTV